MALSPATRRWASYVALSQLRGTEPATWHWASKVALSFELARRQWASKVALSFIIIYIYTPMQSQPCNILDLGKSIFFEGDTYLWAGAGMWNLTLYSQCYAMACPWVCQKFENHCNIMQSSKVLIHDDPLSVAMWDESWIMAVRDGGFQVGLRRCWPHVVDIFIQFACMLRASIKPFFSRVPLVDVHLIWYTMVNPINL